VKRYTLASAVEADLQAIWQHVAEDSIDSADRLLERFYSEFQYLADNPGSGHKREDLTFLPLLFWTTGAYLIVYWTLNRELEVLAVVHGARHIPEFLSMRL